MMLQLNPTIDVSTPNGDGTTLFIIDYGPDVNTVWAVRHAGGKVLHYYSDDIRVYGNPMNGKGWDVEPFGTITKLPPSARRNMNFKKKQHDKKSTQIPQQAENSTIIVSRSQRIADKGC